MQKSWVAHACRRSLSACMRLPDGRRHRDKSRRDVCATRGSSPVDIRREAMLIWLKRCSHRRLSEPGADRRFGQPVQGDY